MSHVDDDLDLENDELDADEQPPATGDKQTPGWRKRLEKDRDTAKAERDALKRENAFLKAGINPEDGKAKWLVKGYDGDLTPEAIKAAAVEAGLIEDTDAGEQDAVPDAERAAHQRISGATTGGTHTGATDWDAQIAAARQAGKTQQVIQLKQAQAAEARSRQGR